MRAGRLRQEVWFQSPAGVCPPDGASESMPTEYGPDFDKIKDQPDASDLFAGDEKFYKKLDEPAQAPPESSVRDLFAGDEQFYESLNEQAQVAQAPKPADAGKEISASQAPKIADAGKGVSASQTPKPADAGKEVPAPQAQKHSPLIWAAVAMSVALLAVILLRYRPSVPAALLERIPTPKKGFADTVEPSEPRAEKPPVEVEPSLAEVELAEARAEAASLEMAESLYAAKEYGQAYSVYEQLAENLSTSEPVDKVMKDFLKLKMALCLHESGGPDGAGAGRLFTTCLQSRSPIVRTMANYNLIFSDLHKKRYLDARMRAYRTIALLSSLEEYLPPALQADCYFLTAESLTKEVLTLSNSDTDLPGHLWSSRSERGEFARIGHVQLWDLLERGFKISDKGSLGPQIKNLTPAGLPARWSVVCFDSPAGEVLSKFAAAGRLEVRWDNPQQPVRNIPVALCLPAATRRDVIEVITGCAGLMSRLDGRQVTVFNPNTYSSLEEHRKLLTKEAMLHWHRFLSRYHDDKRMANGHFALAVLRQCEGETAAAIEEYRLVADRFSKTPLAPAALFNSSGARVKLRDYAGARKDLTELVSQYPDCRVVDQAYLHLAGATMQAGLYDDAERIFRRVYNLNESLQSRIEGALGAARCFYKKRDWPGAEKWLTRYFESVTRRGESNYLGSAYLLLGKTKAALGKFDEASDAFGYALKQHLTDDGYADCLLALAQIQMRRDDFLGALNLLEKMSQEPTADELSCQILATKAQIFRLMGVPGKGIAVLDDVVEYITDARLRAILSSELAKCHAAAGELSTAADILASALLAVEAGDLANEISCQLAEVCLQLEESSQATAFEHSSQAIRICRQVLTSLQPSGEQAGKNSFFGATLALDAAQIRNKALNILGKAYTMQKDYDKAALAFAGIFEQGTDSTSAGLENEETGAAAL